MYCVDAGIRVQSKLTLENSLITAPPLALINGGLGKKKLFNFDYLGRKRPTQVILIKNMADL